MRKRWKMTRYSTVDIDGLLINDSLINDCLTISTLIGISIISLFDQIQIFLHYCPLLNIVIFLPSGQIN